LLSLAFGKFSRPREIIMAGTVSERDPSHHTRRMQERLQDIRKHLREDIEKVDEPQLKAMFDASAEAGANGTRHAGGTRGLGQIHHRQGIMVRAVQSRDSIMRAPKPITCGDDRGLTAAPYQLAVRFPATAGP
jgi:hypothetical protein